MKVFLSCASTEFRSYRLKLANQLGALKGRPYEVRVQEDFQQGGFTLLDQLADYVRACDLVIHLVGDACGARPTPEHVRTMFTHLGVPAPQPLPERSYTQWEYDLAQQFQRSTFCYFATPETPRDCALPVAQSKQDAQLQREHRQRIEDSGKHRESFSGHIDLAKRVFYDLGIGPDKKINNLPFKSIGSLFKGREDFLAQLRETLAGGEHRDNLKIAAIITKPTAATVHGLGGIGKTRAAIEYAHKYADEYTALLFVQADTPEGLQQNIASLCGSLVLDLAEKGAKETEVQVAAVLQWLKQHPGWFLILDNVDTEEAAMAVQKLLARLSLAGQVVITSRIGNWEAGVDTLSLDVLSVDASTEFLLERTERGRTQQDDDPARARELAIELGQLALALEQAGAYIILYGSSFASYLEEWQKSRDRVMQWFHERTMQYPSSVAVTWQTSFDRLSTLARQLLRILSWLAPDPIPESLLQSSESPYLDSSEDEVRLKALAELYNHSFATPVGDMRSFAVHRLVQEVTRTTLPEDERLPILGHTLQWIRHAVSGFTDVSHWSVLNPLLPHALAIVGFAEARNIYEPTNIIMNQAGLILQEKARYAEAEALYRRALALDEQVDGMNDSAVARDLLNLASVLEIMGRLSEAEPYLLRSLELFERGFGPDDTHVAPTLNNLASLYIETGRITEAEPLLRRAIAIFQGRQDRGSMDDLRLTFSNLGSLLAGTNRLAEAEQAYRQGLALAETLYGLDHPKVAEALNNLTAYFGETTMRAEAEAMGRRSLAILEKAYEPDHPSVAVALGNLATTLRMRGRPAEAEPLYRRALEIDEKVFGSEHPHVSRDLNALAVVLRSMSRSEEAEALYLRALKIDEAAFGPDHWRLAIMLNNLANLIADARQPDRAEPYLRRALTILAEFQQETGHQNPYTDDCLRSYIRILRMMGLNATQVRARLRGISPVLESIVDPYIPR